MGRALTMALAIGSACGLSAAPAVPAVSAAPAGTGRSAATLAARNASLGHTGMARHGRCNVLVSKRSHRKKMKCGPVPNLWWYERHYCSARDGGRHCAKPVLWRHCHPRDSHWECPLGEAPGYRHPRHGVAAGAGGLTRVRTAAGGAGAGAALCLLGCGIGLIARRRRGVRAL
jgi:hypothetical protein